MRLSGQPEFIAAAGNVSPAVAVCLRRKNLDLSDGRHVLMRATEGYDRMKHPMPRLQLNVSTRRINELLIQQEFLAIYSSAMHN